jgi:ribosome-associated heat shock protein Hsp15
MADVDTIRLDIWLDVACIFKTRSQAQQACTRGQIKVNGDRGKPHRAIRPGDEIQVSFPGGHRRILVVRDIEEKHVARARARELYEDLTPAPSPEELELRRMQRLASPPRRLKGSGAPKKKERRRLQRIKDMWDD